MSTNADFNNRTELFTRIRNPDFQAPIPIKQGIINPPFNLGQTQFKSPPSPRRSQLTFENLSPPFEKPETVPLPISSPQIMNLSLHSYEETDNNQCVNMDIENETELQMSNFTLKRLSSTEFNLNVKKLSSPCRLPLQKDLKLDLQDFFHMKEILDAFAFTAGKLNPYSDIAQNMIQHHLRARHLEKTTLVSQLSLLASVIAEFASTQYIFASLNKEDQKILLQNNIPLYLQYILARYFSSGSGLEQISWILEGQVSLQTIEDVTNLNLITLDELNAAVCLYSSSTLVELYQYFSETIR